MIHKVIKIDIDLSLLEDEIKLNATHVKMEFNKRILMIQSSIFSQLLKIILNELKVITNEDFNIYSKNIYTFTEINGEEISFNKQLKNDINLISKYSFILLTKSFNTEILLNSKTSNNKIILNDGDLILFDTEDFLGNNCLVNNRIGVYGSITNLIDNTILNKDIIIKSIL